MPDTATRRFGDNTHQVMAPHPAPLTPLARLGALMHRTATAVKSKTDELQDRVSAATWMDVIVVLSKYGVGSVLAIYLVYMLTNGIQGDVRAVQAEARGIRTEHVQMGMYLQAICYGVSTTEQQWRCQVADTYTRRPVTELPLVHPTP